MSFNDVLKSGVVVNQIPEQIDGIRSGLERHLQKKEKITRKLA